MHIIIIVLQLNVKKKRKTYISTQEETETSYCADIG